MWRAGAGRGQGGKWLAESITGKGGAPQDAAGGPFEIAIVKDPALSEGEEQAETDRQSVQAAGGALMPPAAADSKTVDVQAQACAASAPPAASGRPKSFLSLMIGARKAASAKDDGGIVPFPTSPKQQAAASALALTSPQTLSPRAPDAETREDGEGGAHLAGATRLSGAIAASAGGGPPALAGCGGEASAAGSSEAASMADTHSLTSGGGSMSASSSWDLFSRARKDKSSGELSGGGMSRTMILQADSEKDRDAWVRRIRCGMAGRQAVKEALRLAGS